MSSEVVPGSRSDHRFERIGVCTLAIWAALIVLYVLLRSWRLTSYGLWVDEVFSFRAAGLPWSTLFGYVATDVVHPPLFYVLLKVWMAVGGGTLLWLKLLPLLVSIAALLPFWLLCRELNLSLAETTLAFWLIAVNGYLIHYSQELRMYSLLFCLSLWSLWLFFRVVNTQEASSRVVVALFMVNVLLVYTHYFGWLLVGTEWLCILVWRPRLLGWFSVLLTAVALAFGPWAYAVAALPSKGDALPVSLQWIPRPGWAELLSYLATLNGTIPLRHTTPLGIILFGAPIALALVRGVGRHQPPSRRSLGILCMFAFLPVAVAFVASQFMSQSVWGERHLTTVAAPYLLVVAVSLWSVGRVSLRVGVIVVVLVWSGLAGTIGVFGEGGRIPWTSLVQHLIQREDPSLRHVALYTFEGWTAEPLQFLLADQGSQQFDVEVTEPGLIGGGHFWVAFREPTPRIQDQPRSLLEQRGCRLDAEWSVHDGGQRLTVFRANC